MSTPQKADAAPSRLLTIDEAAEYLQVSKKTLYQWRTLRTGPVGRKVGHLVRYRLSDIDAWLDRDAEAA